MKGPRVAGSFYLGPNTGLIGNKIMRTQCAGEMRLNDPCHNALPCSASPSPMKQSALSTTASPDRC